MTIEEAIVELKELQTVAKVGDDISEKALSLAIDALEKRIPTKIKDGNYAGRCNCGKFVFKDQNFCPICGQALEWGDSE